MALAVQVTNIYIYNYYKTKLLPDFFVAIYLQYTIKKNKVGWNKITKWIDTKIIYY